MESSTFGDPPLDIQLKACSEGADAFVTSFYRDINNGNSLSSYYIDASTLYAAANESADIVINGAKLNASAEYETLLDEQRGGPIPENSPSSTNGSGGPHRRNNTATKNQSSMHYEVDGFDAQPINFDFQLALPSILPRGETAHGGGCISMLVSVMGILYLSDYSHHDGSGDGGPPTSRKIFTDTFVLWPNWAARGRSAAARSEKHRFLVASQNYRTL